MKPPHTLPVLLLSLVLHGVGPRLLGAEARASEASDAPPPKADLVIVGTGISGLAAALDAGRAGANVTVIDMWSVFGGHAVMSGGLVCLVDTPFQRAHNVADSPDLAIRDFQKAADLDPQQKKQLAPLLASLETPAEPISPSNQHGAPAACGRPDSGSSVAEKC